MKRTTLDLENQIFSRTKQLCKEQGRTLKEVVNDLLRIGLNAARPHDAAKHITLPQHHKNGPMPGINVADRQALHDILNETA